MPGSIEKQLPAMMRRSSWRFEIVHVCAGAMHFCTDAVARPVEEVLAKSLFANVRAAGVVHFIAGNRLGRI